MKYHPPVENALKWCDRKNGENEIINKKYNILYIAWK